MELRNTVLTIRILCNSEIRFSWFAQQLNPCSAIQEHLDRFSIQAVRSTVVHGVFKPRSSAANCYQKQMLKPLHLQSARFIFVCLSTELLNHQVLCGSTNGFANISKGPLSGWRGPWNGENSTAKLVASKSQSSLKVVHKIINDRASEYHPNYALKVNDKCTAKGKHQ